jgi:hypothetical protein
VQNEGLYLREWLEFHRLAGIEHVFIYDDGSSDNSAEILRRYISSGFVTRVPWASFHSGCSKQELAYAHALCTFGPGWRWMAFIDVDEFLFPARPESLAAALSGYEDYPAIAVPWLMFGFCGHKHRPPGLVIESYTRRAPFPPHTAVSRMLKWKCIVDPMQVGAVAGPHFFVLANGTQGAYDENRSWVPGVSDGGHIDTAASFGSRLHGQVFRLNHYFTKSEEEFSQKKSRPTVVSFGGERKLAKVLARRDMLSALIEAESVEDDAIQRYVPELRRIAGEDLSSWP